MKNERIKKQTALTLHLYSHKFSQCFNNMLRAKFLAAFLIDTYDGDPDFETAVLPHSPYHITDDPEFAAECEIYGGELVAEKNGMFIICYK